MSENRFNWKKELKSITDVHFLMGCRLDIYWKLLCENNFRISLKKLPRVVLIGLYSLVLFPFALIEEAFSQLFVYPFTKLKSPVFILGHWRSGTTYLFELMACDEQFVCFNPASTYTTNNFLLLRRLIDRIQSKEVGGSRPMDNMAYTIDSPSEETFAMASRSTKSCMNMLVFPQDFTRYRRYAYTKTLSIEERALWEKKYIRVLKKVVYEERNGRSGKSEKRLLLKSPDNTCRVAELLHLFPNARFIHIYRNPYRVVKSTINMIDSVMDMLTFQQIPPHDVIEDEIINMYRDLYMSYMEEEKQIPREHLIEIRYEDFIQEPIHYLKGIYAKLGIKGYRRAEPAFLARIKQSKDYQPNQFFIDEKLKAKINRELKFAFDYYGYEIEE